MKHFENYERIIANSERSAGNESVGEMWVKLNHLKKVLPYQK